MKVTIWSSPTCPWCQKTKEFFKKYKIEFREINVAADAKAIKEMIEKSGQQGIPVVEVDGKIIVGYDEPELKKALKISR